MVLIKSSYHNSAKKKQESEWTEEKPDKPKIPLWCQIDKKGFEELINDVCDNDFKITINKKTYDLKNGKNVLREVTTRKISKREAKKIVQRIDTKDIDALEGEKSNDAKTTLFSLLFWTFSTM